MKRLDYRELSGYDLDEFISEFLSDVCYNDEEHKENFDYYYDFLIGMATALLICKEKMKGKKLNKDVENLFNDIYDHIEKYGSKKQFINFLSVL